MNKIFTFYVDTQTCGQMDELIKEYGDSILEFNKSSELTLQDDGVPTTIYNLVTTEEIFVEIVEETYTERLF